MADGVNIGNITIPIIKGDKGDKGESASIAALSISILAPNAEAYVRNAGTDIHAVIEFGIPKGDGLQNAEIDRN